MEKIFGVCHSNGDKKYITYNGRKKATYPDQSWKDIQDGPIVITSLKEFDHYQFAMGENRIFTIPEDIFEEEVKTYQKMFPDEGIQAVRVIDHPYGSFGMICTKDYEIALVLGKDQYGNVCNLMDLGIRITNLPDQEVDGKTLKAKFTKKSTELNKFKPREQEAFVYKYLDELRVDDTYYNMYYPDRLLNHNLHVGPAIVTAVKSMNGRYEFCVAHNIPMVELNDWDATFLAKCAMRNQRTCIGFVETTDPKYGTFTAIIHAYDENEFDVVECYTYKNKEGNYYNFNPDEIGINLDNCKMDNFKYLGIPESDITDPVILLDPDPLLLDLDNVEQFILSSRGMDQVSDERLLNAQKLNIVKFYTMTGTGITFIDVNWHYINGIFKMNRDEVREMIDTINEVNAAANQRAKSMIKKGKIKLSI